MKTLVHKPFKSNQVHNVLIALDYDTSAEKVAEIGYSLAKSMNAEVILLHVVGETNYYSTLEYSPIVGFGGFSNSYFSQLIDMDGLKKASQYFLDQMKIHLSDDAIQTRIQEGDSAESILEAATEIKADLIVMGSHSRRWLDKILMGSVTEKVLHNTNIPLFIIPIKEQNK